MSDGPDHIQPEDTLPAGKVASASDSGHRTLQLLSSSARQLRSLADLAAVSTNPGVFADTHGQTDPGRVRASNEDQFLVAALERSLLIEGSSLPTEAGTRLTDTPQGRLFMVADGIGGHGGGEVASAVAIDAMAHYAFATMPWVSRGSDCSRDDLETGLREALENAQNRMRRVAERKKLDQGLGTTFTMAYVTWPDLYIVHVGDSRAYLLRSDRLHRITRDHTLAQQLIDGEAMTEEEAMKSRFSHVLVNALGGHSDDLDVELHHIELREGDQLLLCSDGLYDMVSDEGIGAIARDTSRPVATIVKQLIAAANDAGGHDNITVVLSRF